MSKIFVLAVVFTTILELSDGIGLDCNFGLSSWQTIGHVYTCTTTNITIDMENKESMTTVNGTHQSGRTNADVQGLYILNKGMGYFPVNIVEFFPNIRALDFYANSISYVNNQHLFPLPNLVFLSLHSNAITSLDSNLFSGLSMKYIRFSYNNIKHVGHDFILPNTLPSGGIIEFNFNPCINRYASTPGEITDLRISLLENCQPNWLTNVTVQTQSLFNRTNIIEQSHFGMGNEIKSLTNAVAELQHINAELTNEVAALTNEVTDLQASNVELTAEVVELSEEVTDLRGSNVELINEVTSLQLSNVELSNEVTALTDEVTDLQNKNSQLETRIGFVDTRAGYLEVRVAVLESIIESLKNQKD